MDAYAKSRTNDLIGLGWLSRFGWLRTAELGKLLWPKSKGARQQADRLARRWLERRLVLARELPEGAGRALVLATAGVRLLAEVDASANSGKDIGIVTGETWRPPLSWRHDLLAAGVLAELHKEGWTVFPEREIRQRQSDLAKYPDGIAVKGADVAWLEVERATKTGPNGRQLVAALCAAGEGTASAVVGHKPTVALVAYQPDAIDTRGCAINHRARITTAVANATKTKVKMMWAACELRGPAGLGKVTFTRETIEADLAGAILKRMEWRESPEEEGVLVASYGERLGAVWEEQDGLWGYQVDNRQGGLADTEADAKRACAVEIASMSKTTSKAK